MWPVKRANLLGAGTSRYRHFGLEAFIKVQSAIFKDITMSETKIDRETMGKLVSALNFICGAGDPAAIALKNAAESGNERDIKRARALFLKPKPGHRQAALAMVAS